MQNHTDYSIWSQQNRPTFRVNCDNSEACMAQMSSDQSLGLLQSTFRTWAVMAVTEGPDGGAASTGKNLAAWAVVLGGC